MAKTRGEARAARLRQMEEKYRLRAYTDQEMADDLQVRRETVHEDRQAIQDDGAEFEQIERGRYKIKKASFLSQIRLNPLQSLPLYLFARKSARQIGIAQAHVIEAMEKLALCIQKPMTDKLAQAAKRLALNPRAEQQVKVFEQITEGWIDSRRIDIDYVRLGGTHEVRHTINPYLIEPSVWSDAIYVIGWSEPDKRIMPFKLDRINYAFVRGDHFEEPKDFDEHELLKHAWGVWTASGKAQWVRLRFTDGVAIQRLKETRWHPLQTEPQDQPDGSCIWAAPVAEWREMLPWVRGWGSSVEVLEPEELRRELVLEVRRMGRVYGITQTTVKDTLTAQVLRCWGKTGAGGSFHPAAFHMLDVANVARVLLSEDAPPRWRQTLARALNVDATQLNQWLPYFIALHDIGKISIPFQAQNAKQVERMKREGFVFEGWRQDDFIRHEVISRIFIEDTNMPEVLRRLREAISGHHGKFTSKEKTRDARHLLRREHANWHALRQKTNELMRDALLMKLPDEAIKPDNISVAIMALSGFMVLCDWVGSDARFFTPRADDDWESYLVESQERAIRAADSAGLLLPVMSDASSDVMSLFADLGQLRPLQMAVNDIPDVLFQTPTLTIIEAPTGEGKTETSLALARRIAEISDTDELFYALPTMATSNQMFSRLQKHLRERLHLNTQVKLAHGQAFLVEDDLRAESALAEIELLSNGDDSRESSDAMAWFSGKKRALLAPFGVGTVDQIELAVLNVKHGALRMAGLLGKVIIVDEVHAYDTYMTTIIERLLAWLAQLGTSVILLSATLPLSRRERLLKAYGAMSSLTDEQARAYPSLLVANAQMLHQASPEVWQPNRIIALSELHFGDEDTEAEAKARWLLAQIADGGCACWMANTVKRAQRIFVYLRKLAPASIRLDLLHSQFPLEERQRLESDLSALYGRKNDAQPRPDKGIVVGTQVLEQSLDLDFDVMMSDLAPIDLLLQRAGRLHRHDRLRPTAHTIPRLYVNFEVDQTDNLKLGSDRRIYAPFIIRKTHQTLLGRTDRQISLPTDYRVLIEAVYGGLPPNDSEPFYDDWLDLKSKEDAAKVEANQRLAPVPDPVDSFAEIVAKRTELIESENQAGYFVAQTRLGEPSLNVIPLERVGDMLQLAGESISVKTEASRATQLLLLRRHLRISNPQAIAAIERYTLANPTRLFRQSTLLEDFYPLWLTNGQTRLEAADGKTLVFTLDPDMGLVIDKDKKDDTANDNHE